jgi:ankyrin repeat protein
VVKFLIENGADPTIKDEQGKTPRDRAAAITDEKVRQELLNLMGKSG